MKKGSRRKTDLEYRMYGLVPYNISPIQQGIQYGHAVVEYGLLHPNDDNYLDWARYDKTFIILNGGTSNFSIDYVGTMQKHTEALRAMGVKFATFVEPDLNDMLSAIVFIVDERVFDKEKYPDYSNLIISNGARTIIPTQTEEEWIKSIGGQQNAQLRTFLKDFRLA